MRESIAWAYSCGSSKKSLPARLRACRLPRRFIFAGPFRVSRRERTRFVSANPGSGIFAFRSHRSTTRRRSAGDNFRNVSQLSVAPTSGTNDAIQDSSSRRISAARRMAARNEGPKARSIAGITRPRSRLRVCAMFALVASSRYGTLCSATNAVISPRVSPSIGRMISRPCVCASGFMPARPAAPVPRRKLNRQVSIWSSAWWARKILLQR